MKHEIYFGLAQWHHPQWYSHKAQTQSLVTYSKSFSCVEGNHSFYAIPSLQNIHLWNDTIDEHFRFCFKFPKEITHKQRLTHCSRQVGEFLNRISLLKYKIGLIWLQLDQYFDGRSLNHLELFLQSLPNDFNYAVEVRHLCFFAKGEIELRFNQLLHKYHINRVIFDTRSLFKHDYLNDTATREALNAKPKVPTHVIATANQPMVRLIVPMDQDLAKLEIEQWVNQTVKWLEQGKTPYLFFHTPDNASAPQLACDFSTLLAQKIEELVPIRLWPQGMQDDLF